MEDGPTVSWTAFQVLNEEFIITESHLTDSMRNFRRNKHWGKTYTETLQKLTKTWLQIVHCLSQKGPREFKYSHTGADYLHSHV